jgi:hypothetical protein
MSIFIWREETHHPLSCKVVILSVVAVDALSSKGEAIVDSLVNHSVFIYESLDLLCGDDPSSRKS